MKTQYTLHCLNTTRFFFEVKYDFSLIWKFSLQDIVVISSICLSEILETELYISIRCNCKFVHTIVICSQTCAILVNLCFVQEVHSKHWSPLLYVSETNKPWQNSSTYGEFIFLHLFLLDCRLCWFLVIHFSNFLNVRKCRVVKLTNAVWELYPCCLDSLKNIYHHLDFWLPI